LWVAKKYWDKVRADKKRNEKIEVSETASA
jgi:hypothetical protein